MDARNLTEPEQQRESSLKNQTRCVRCYAEGHGFALSTIEGRVAMEFFDSAPEVQAKKCSKIALPLTLLWIKYHFNPLGMPSSAIGLPTKPKISTLFTLSMPSHFIRHLAHSLLAAVTATLLCGMASTGGDCSSRGNITTPSQRFLSTAPAKLWPLQPATRLRRARKSTLPTPSSSSL